MKFVKKLLSRTIFQYTSLNLSSGQLLFESKFNNFAYIKVYARFRSDP